MCVILITNSYFRFVLIILLIFVLVVVIGVCCQNKDYRCLGNLELINQ